MTIAATGKKVLALVSIIEKFFQQCN